MRPRARPQRWCRWLPAGDHAPSRRRGSAVVRAPTASHQRKWQGQNKRHPQTQEAPHDSDSLVAKQSSWVAQAAVAPAPLKARSLIPELRGKPMNKGTSRFIANEELWNEIHDYVAEGKGVLRHSRLLWAGLRKAPATQERRQHGGGYESYVRAQGVTSSQGRASAHGTWCQGI